MSEANHAAFDKDEQEILSKIVPELDTVEGSDALPDATTATPAASDAPAATPVPTPAEAPAAVAPAAPAAPAEAPAAAVPATPEATAAPQGDTRAALRASRRAEKRLRDELDQVRQENEALKQGKGPVDTSISDEELAQLEEDFPLQAKIVRRQRELEAQISQAATERKTDAQPDFEPVSYRPEVQEVIDSVPDLVEWQYDPAAQDKFQRAIEYDKALAVDPDWKDRSIAERFAEAARKTKAALSPAPTPTPAAVPAAPRVDPAVALANAQVEGPKGISDFRGGAPGNPPSIDYTRMTDEQIMSSLPVS